MPAQHMRLAIREHNPQTPGEYGVIDPADDQQARNEATWSCRRLSAFQITVRECKLTRVFVALPVMLVVVIRVSEAARVAAAWSKSFCRSRPCTIKKCAKHMKKSQALRHCCSPSPSLFLPSRDVECVPFSSANSTPGPTPLSSACEQAHLVTP